MDRTQRSTHGRGASAAGFTLIELVVTIAVVGILMAIAVESYAYAMVKARRGAAQSCLTEAAQYAERVYTTSMSYASIGSTFPAIACKTDASLTPYYSFSVVGAADATTFKLQATPKPGSSQAGEHVCGTMTIDQKGTRTPASGCW